MNVKLKTITPNAEVNIVEIARVSSSRVDKTEAPENLINYLIRNKHWSPFQHAYATFEITTSKAIGIQLLRHLSFTFQEFSQRYAVVENMEPIEFRMQAEKNRQSSTDVLGGLYLKDGVMYVSFPELWSNDLLNYEILQWIKDVAENLENTFKLYKRGIELGVAKETARFILPMATETKIYMTGSIRSWLSFLNIRLDEHSQKEARELSLKIAEIIKQEFPIISKSTNNFNNFKGMFM